MSSLSVFVGLDYHQDGVQACVLDADGKSLANRSVANDAAAIAAAIGRHGAPQRIAVEACCGAADLAEELATTYALPVQLAHPGYVNRMKRSPDKTDLGDAQLLADLARVNYLPRVWLAPRATRELRRLVRHRTNLVRQRTDVKLRLRGLLRENRLLCPHSRAWTQAWQAWLENEAELSASDRWLVQEQLALLTFLNGQITAALARIEAAVADDPLVAKLLTLFGVGLITAATLRAEIGRFDRFDTGKQLARFCGVTPRNASSGARQADAGLIKAGNPDLRHVLIELAHRLVRCRHEPWCGLAHGMLQRGKPKNVVIAAVANRWVRWLFHELQRPLEKNDAPTSARAQQKEVAPSVSAAASTAARG